MKKRKIRGMQVRMTLDLLLDLIGLERGDIQLGAVAVDIDNPDVLVLVLRGDDSRLPEVPIDGAWPKGFVEVTTDNSRPGLTGKIETYAS